MTDKKRPFRGLVNKLKEIRKERLSEEKINELNRIIEESKDQAETDQDNYQDMPKKIAREKGHYHYEDQRAPH